MSGHKDRILGALASRLGRRVILLFVISAMVPLAAIAVYSLTEVSDQLRDEAHRRLRYSVKSLGMTAMERLQVLERDLQALASQLDGDPDRLEIAAAPFEARLAERFEGLQMVEVASGRTVGHALAPLDILPTLDSDDERHLARPATAVKVAPGPVGEMTRGVYLVLRATTSPETRVFARVRPDYLWGGDAFIPPDTELFVLGPDRQPLFGSSDHGVPMDDLLAAMEESPRAGAFEWAEGDEPHLGAYWKLFAKEQFDTSWTFAHGQPAIESLGALYRFRHFFILVVVLATATVVLLSLVQIRRSLGPITKLGVATRRVTEGDLTVELDIESGDEFEDLSKAFNAMVCRLAANVERRAQVERELVASRDAAIEASKREAEFVQNVSHELRTPMTSIRAYSEILREYGDEDPATRAEFLDIILSESDRLTRLIDQVLDFSKVHAENSDWTLEDVELGEVVARTVQALDPVARETGVELDASQVECSLYASVDRDRMQQVLTNVVGNAIKFGQSGGRVQIRMRGESDQVVIEVQDWGEGIAGDDKQVVFERFRQVTHDSMTAKPNGTGLGLAITRDIVVKLGGEIVVESELGEGATFRITLPLVSQASLAGV